MYFTKRQLEVLDFIRHFVAHHRVAPTLDEMASHFQVSRITIHEHVKALEQKRVLKRTRNRARSIELKEAGDASQVEARLILPVLGLVQAGTPSEPFEAPEEFDFDGWIRNPGDFHLLRVTGDSMINDHIDEGDLVLINRKQSARDGDIVVAATPDGEVTLKRIYRETNRVRLQPSHPTMQAMYYDSADVRGVVVGLIRRF